MQHSRTYPYLACIVLLLALSGCQAVQPPIARTDALFQVSLLDALMQGDYDGTLSVGELLQHGDTGLGTFDRLDGEMIVLDGVVYKAKADGSVEVVEESETVPFAAVAYFDAEIPAGKWAALPNIEDIKAALDAIIAERTDDLNQFYIATIEGNFDMAHVRSVPVQSKPYKPLAEVTKGQSEYVYENLPGTLIALRVPDHMQGINLPGWHLHFLSDDKSKGGHVLDVALANGNVNLDVVREFELVQPATATFAGLDLGSDLSEETESVESK